MYNEYFGLDEAPFSISPNPRYLFMSKRHREALAHLIYGINHGGGFVLLTGEVGTGKTTISRCLLQQLPKNTDIAYLLNPYLDAIELLASVCDELGIENVDRSSPKSLSDSLHRFLLENHAKGRNTVLIIDEAQHLQYQVMEQVRLLTNLETDEKKLLQIVFIGQPELNELLAKPELRQLAQRITAKFHIEPLTMQETGSYIRHRLMIAGMPANQSLFTLNAVRTIHKATKGIPRLINVACDRALLGAYTHNLPKVDTDLARKTTQEIAGKRKPSSVWYRLPQFWLSCFAGLLVLTGGALAYTLYKGVPHEEYKGVPHEDALPARDATRTSTLPRSPSPIDPDAANLEQSLTSPSKNTELPKQNRSTTPTIAANSSINTTVVEEAASKPFDLRRWTYSNREEALATLQVALGISPTIDDPCEQLVQGVVHCGTHQSRDWLDLETLNRPGVIEFTVNGRKRFGAVRFMASNRLTLQKGEEQTAVSVFELGRYWQGKFIFLWRPPVKDRVVARIGQRSELVKWIADSFATLDQQPNPLTDDQYTSELKERVKIFQEENGLTADGVVGVQTLLKINDFLGTDFSLANAAEVSE